MDTIAADAKLVANCGLYCGACGSYLKGRCKGCHENEKATWCGVRKCCGENGYATCAECKEHADPNTCKLYNNFMSRLFGFIFRSNRPKCIARIREIGTAAFAEEMAAARRQSLPR